MEGLTAFFRSSLLTPSCGINRGGREEKVQGGRGGAPDDYFDPFLPRSECLGKKGTGEEREGGRAEGE